MSNNTNPYDSCTEVGPDCPVAATVLGYYPNLGSGIFFTAAFGLCLIAAVGLGVWKRTWTYTVAITIGLILEFAGYIGRILMHSNPWASGPFQLQICAIILAPTFICVSIYLTLKHVALNLNPNVSRIAPKWYPRIFLPADLTCLIVQAIGGGIAAAAGHDKPDLQETGNRMIIAGVALQVVVLAFFGVMGVDYWLRFRRYLSSDEGRADDRARSLWNDFRFRVFGIAVVTAFVVILIRCIYRIAEMAGGWGNHIMQDEISFLILDPTLVLVAVYLLTIFHPGLLFPQMSHGAIRAANHVSRDHEKANESAESSNEGIKTGSSGSA